MTQDNTLPDELLDQLLATDPDIMASAGAALLPAMKQVYHKDHWPADAEAWAEKYIKTAKSLLVENGMVDAISVFLSLEEADLVDTIVMTGHLMKNDRTKDLLAQTLVGVAEDLGAFAVLFASEVWMVVEDRDDEDVEGDENDIASRAKQHPDVVANNGSLAFHPERREFLMITLETRAGVKMYQYEITRDDEGNPIVSDDNYSALKDNQDLKYKGRFVGLLSDVPQELQ